MEGTEDSLPVETANEDGYIVNVEVEAEEEDVDYENLDLEDFNTDLELDDFEE